MIPKDSLVGVFGAGVMGAGIAQVAAAAGHRVLLFDASPGAASEALDGIRASLQKRFDQGKLSAADLEATTNRIASVDSMADFADASLVIEAIAEDLQVKVELFQKLGAVVSDQCLLATNTSSLSITKLAANLREPGRFGGMHFFNPAPAMGLVEVVSGLRTSAETAESIFATAKAWGKTPVRVRDAPGFIVNRGARPFYSESLKFVEEGGADFSEVDDLFRANGFRLGPFELIDLVGLDVNLAVSRSLWEAYYGEPRYRPSRLVEERVDAGMLGKKSKQGFYRYPPEPNETSEARCNAVHLDIGIESPFECDFPGAIVARTVCMLVNEACDTVLRGIASVQDVDLAMKLGMNFPAGPFEWCDRLGADYCLGVLDKLMEAYGDDRYRASILLRSMAKSGAKFYA